MPKASITREDALRLARHVLSDEKLDGGSDLKATNAILFLLGNGDHKAGRQRIAKLALDEHEKKSR